MRRHRWQTVAWLSVALLLVGGVGLYLARPDAPAVRHVKDRLARLRVGMTMDEVAAALEADRLEALTGRPARVCASVLEWHSAYELSPRQTLCHWYANRDKYRVQGWELRTHPEGQAPSLPFHPHRLPAAEGEARP